MFDFLSSPEPDESDPSADDTTVRPAEASTSALTAAETTAVASDEAEETLTDSASPAEPTSEEIEAPNDTEEEEPPDAPTKRKAPTVVPKAATGEEAVIDLVDQVDLPDFSHEPTEPGQYTLHIVFTFRPGDQSVLFSTKSHDVLAIVGELEPTGTRALLAPFIAAHEGRLGEIKQALTQPKAKAPARVTTATKAAARLAAAKKKAPTQKDKAAKTAQPTPPAVLPQTNLFPD